MHTAPSKAATLGKQKHMRCRCLPSRSPVGSSSGWLPSPEDWYSAGHYPLPPSSSLPTTVTFTPNQQTSCILADGLNPLLSLAWHLI